MSPHRARIAPPVVTILGVPNAGKSTLFNRLIGERRALVTDLPGTTRDRIYARVRFEGKGCLLCDTGGVAGRGDDALQSEIRRQTFAATEEAAVLILVLDGRAGLTGADRELASSLRPHSDRIVVVWNKVDDPSHEAGSAEAFELGLGPPIAVSAEHGLGIADLVEAIAGHLPASARDVPPGPGDETRVAIVGRPNVGKSSLLNRLCGSARVTVGAEPGTTRDAVDTEVKAGGRLYRFVDTAGLRRPSRATGPLERLGVMAAKRALSRADVALVVFDAAEGLAAQDLTVAGLVEESGKGAVLVANKWDRVEGREQAIKELKRELLARLRYARFAPLVSVSALEGLRVPHLFEQIDRVYEAAGVTVPTPKLNRFLEEFRRGATEGGPRGPKLRYMTQVGVRPPSFVVFGPSASQVHFSESRRLENRLREAFGIGPTPIRLRFRGEGRRTGGHRGRRGGVGGRRGRGT